MQTYVISKEIEQLQEQVRRFYKERKRIALYSSSASHTTRSKAYNHDGAPLDLDALTAIHVDAHKQCVYAEPRVTIEQLVRETNRYGLIPPIVPEFKGITIGGAIMGCAAESGAHKWGIFSDLCTAFYLISGKGELIYASRRENSALFYAIPGSYGSLGLLVLAEIELIKVPQSVSIRYKTVKEPYTRTSADFLDGIAFNKDLTVMIEGSLTDQSPTTRHWYFEKAKEGDEVILPLETYLFRYDPGAFWIGAYLLKPSFLSRYISQGLFNFPSKPSFSQKMLNHMRPLPKSNRFWLHFLSSRRLWKLHHKAEKWVQEHLIIQDCCLPVSQAATFLAEVRENPGVFPIWLCPIKKSSARQIFAPHDLGESILNIGLYGLPSYPISTEKITKHLEQRIRHYGGRKVLYSRSFYSHEEFWEIYDYKTYKALRQQTAAEGVWPEITEKVLSA